MLCCVRLCCFVMCCIYFIYGSSSRVVFCFIVCVGLGSVVLCVTCCVVLCRVVTSVLY